MTPTITHSIELEQLEQLIAELQEKLTIATRISKTPRNAPCPCGSGKKVKKCHLPLADKSLPFLKTRLRDAEWRKMQIKAKISIQTSTPSTTFLQLPV